MIADYFEALTGYRAWGVHDNGLLVGVSKPQPWPPYQPVSATCHDASSAHLVGGWLDAPVLDCTCGIYCYKAPLPADYGASPWPASCTVWGSIKIWGRIIEHEMGYRAQYAYPATLNTSVSPQMAAKLEQLYGVPCAYVKPKIIEDEDLVMGHWLYGHLTGVHPNNLGAPPVFLGIVRSTHSFWRNQPPPPTPPIAPTTPVIHTPTFAQIRSLGASRFQRRQQLTQAGRRSGKTNWRELLRKMIFLKPDVSVERQVDALTIKPQL